MSKRNSIAFHKPPEPKFLKQMKEAIGYKEPDSIEAKRQKLSSPDDDDDEREDERPTVLVDESSGTLSQKDIDQALTNRDTEIPSDGRIMFRKPRKTASKESAQKDPTAKKTRSAAAVKNNSLLSFDDGDDDAGDDS